MIVKNESRVIRRSLDSVRNHISCWVICDTGSTDGTQRIVSEYFQKHRIPGMLHEVPWVDFGHNRTECLRLAKDKAQFVLMLDADEVVVVNDRRDGGPFAGMSTRIHAYTIEMSGSLYYRVPVVTCGDREWAYRGVTHEHLDIDRRTRVVGKWDGFVLRHLADGSNRADKYTRDIRMLSRGLREQPDNKRYHFYMAESYRNTKRYAEACEWYAKRVRMGGWPEEVYYSLYQYAKCKHHMIRSHDAFERHIRPLYLKAYHFRPTRLEAVYELASYYSRRKDYVRAYSYCMIAYPQFSKTTVHDDILFVHRPIYTHAFRRLLETSATHVPPHVRRRMSKKIRG
jgi:glycosyltransferase involved in cell wall biosynthesis